ncbi:MAG: metalloregulator ArsR/SmtB family transcription factor [Veillonellaceae bacterium]|nr:metalloregulator ArsR/SmtB family transcription factor [Veillonellaceae bacterium]
MMDLTYQTYSTVFKALSDETRLRIIDMLSCSELSACDILKSFSLSQSTLSYHMKILVESGVVTSRRDGLWMRYSICEERFEDILQFLPKLYKEKDTCVCRQIKYCREDAPCVADNTCTL